MATARRPVPPQTEGVNFGSLEMYVAGGGLPEGDYALEFNVIMFQAQTQAGIQKGPPRLGVQIVAHSLTDPSSAPREQFYSMGTNADKSFAPNPNTGKGLVPIPGGVAATLPQSTNWAIFLKSLYDSGLPEGIFTNDLSVLDGVHVHTSNIPEPEERKGFQSRTGEAAEDRKPGIISVVTEIKDDGKPWEGSGGIPEAGSAPAKGPVKVVKPAVPIRKPVAAPPPAAAEEDTDVKAAAINAISSVIEKSPDGTTKLKLRTETFKSAGQEMGQAIIETYFGDDEALNSILGELGYGLVGSAIKPV
jgi:hypothetical protein